MAQGGLFGRRLGLYMGLGLAARITEINGAFGFPQRRKKMTDAQNATRHAVTYVNDVPMLELLADEFILPVQTRDERWKLLIHMKPYQPYAVKKFYDQVLPRRKRRTASETQVQVPDYADVRAFVMEHFVRFEGALLPDGTEPTVQQQRQWLAENPEFVERIFRDGIDRVGARQQAQDPDVGKPVLMFGVQELKTPLEFPLYSPERKTDETVSVVAVQEQWTESERRQYEKAITFIENSRRGESYSEANWDVIELMCNRKLKRLEGALVGGAPCTEANKDAWVGRLLIIPKIYIMVQASLEIGLKNA
jgi:hypothetical protein